MEESRIKEIEAKLQQLFLQNDQTNNHKSLNNKTIREVRVIRRRKGKPDLHIT